MKKIHYSFTRTKKYVSNIILESGQMFFNIQINIWKKSESIIPVICNIILLVSDIRKLTRVGIYYSSRHTVAKPS